MKLTGRILSGLIGLGAVSGFTAALIIVNKSDVIDAGPVNQDMHHIDGFGQNDGNSNQEIKTFELKNNAAKSKFEAFLEGLGFDSTMSVKTLNMEKFISALEKSNIDHSNPIDKYGNSFLIRTGSSGKYVIASFGDKYHAISTLIDKLKKLTTKPTYEEFINLFSERDRINVNKILRLSFNDISRESLGISKPSS